MIARLIPIVVIAISAISAAPVGKAPTVPPRRIVSISLCADQLVLDLADRSQIAGLSRNAADASLSAAATRAVGIKLLRNSAEELLVANPDMIVAIPKSPGGASAALDAKRYRTIDAPDAESYPAIVDRLRLIGMAVGHPERADAIIARMNARLAALPPHIGRGRVAAYYQRRGYMTGTGTLIDDLMRRLGLVNLAARLGKPPLSQLSLEEVVAARPDFLILESATATVTDQGTEMLHHPALRDIPTLWIPQAWTVCGAPEYVLAAESLARQIMAIDRSRRH